MNAFFFVFLAATPLVRPIAEQWDPPAIIFARIGAIALLVFLNGFFVAAEFALVKVRGSQLEALTAEGNRGAGIARQVMSNLDAYLSACQLGITLASLGLGWLGEPFLAHMLQPLFGLVSIQSPTVIRTTSFFLAFSAITCLHIVLGEQAPKILAIRKALGTAIVVSPPLRLFYLIFRPAIWFLNASSNWVLRHIFRIEPKAESEASHSEEELRLILDQSEKADEVSELGRDLLVNALDLRQIGYLDRVLFGQIGKVNLNRGRDVSRQRFNCD
jgi:CBS domain containing-hemolysin-like protein